MDVTMWQRYGVYASSLSLLMASVGCDATVTKSERPNDGGSDVGMDGQPDTATTPRPCGPSTCPGCCDPNGDCRAGTESNACGSSGGACVDCVPLDHGCDEKTRQCSGPVPCSPSNCQGCCLNQNTCMPGTTSGACGVPGSFCTNCAAGGLVCNTTTRVCGPPPCGPGVCKGCCDTAGRCVPGTENAACGLYGQSCIDCASKKQACDTATFTCKVAAAGCRSTYGGCDDGLQTPQPVTSLTACSQANLGAIQEACASNSSGTCEAVIAKLEQTSPICVKCISQLLGRNGRTACAAPFLTQTCNHELSCLNECLAMSCDGCPSQVKDACVSDAYQKADACGQFVRGIKCSDQASTGQAAMCTPGIDQGKFLYAAGTYYCGSGPL